MKAEEPVFRDLTDPVLSQGDRGFRGPPGPPGPPPHGVEGSTTTVHLPGPPVFTAQQIFSLILYV